MSRDSYSGIRKKFPLLINEDGDVEMNKPGAHNLKVDEVGFKPVLTGSGTLVAGYTYVTDPSIGWHSIALVTPVSGTGGTTLSGSINYTVDVANAKVHFSGINNTDTRKFAYAIFNPGLKTPKVS